MYNLLTNVLKERSTLISCKELARYHLVVINQIYTDIILNSHQPRQLLVEAHYG